MTYILAESDFKIIAYLNAVALGFFSASSLSFSIFLSFLTGWMFADNPTLEIQLIGRVVTFASIGFTFIFLVVALISLYRRKGHIQQIRNETREKH